MNLEGIDKRLEEVQKELSKQSRNFMPNCLTLQLLTEEVRNIRLLLLQPKQDQEQSKL